jgi:hypothetical protein
VFEFSPVPWDVLVKVSTRLGSEGTGGGSGPVIRRINCLLASTKEQINLGLIVCSSGQSHGSDLLSRKTR